MEETKQSPEYTLLGDSSAPPVATVENGPKRGRLRWGITFLCFAGVALSLWSRTAESVAVIQWGEECGFQSQEKKEEQFQLSAFYYGYLVSMVGGGWLSGRFGGHVVMGGAVVGSCVVSALTPLSGCHVGLAAATRSSSLFISNIFSPLVFSNIFSHLSSSFL